MLSMRLATKLAVLVFVMAAGIHAQQPDVTAWSCSPPNCYESASYPPSFQIQVTVNGWCDNGRSYTVGTNEIATNCDYWASASVIGGAYHAAFGVAGYIRADGSASTYYANYSEFVEWDCNGNLSEGGGGIGAC